MMFQVKAKFEGVSEKKTKTNLTFSTTEEMNSLELIQMEKAFGYISFTPDLLKKRVEDVMKDRKIGINESGFSPSAFLRGVLFQVWEKSKEEIPFDEWYRNEVNKIGNHYKQKYL